MNDIRFPKAQLANEELLRRRAEQRADQLQHENASLRHQIPAVEGKMDEFVAEMTGKLDHAVQLCVSYRSVCFAMDGC